jgi:hypothetical protein
VFSSSLAPAARRPNIAGDFIESVAAADLHLLKFVLHDWDDPELRRDSLALS